MSLVIVGSLAFDTIETPFARRERVVGGSATYCALAASFFTPPKIVGVVGEDFPPAVLRFFRSRKIDTRGIEIRPGKTFFWAGRYGYDPNQRETLRTELNVFGNFQPKLPPSYRRPSIIFLSNIDPDLHEGILSQVEKPALVALDTINFWIVHKPDPLWQGMTRVDIFFANEEEIKMLTRETNLIKAGKNVLARGPRLVIVKKGEHGALVLGRDFVFGVLGHPCEDVIDPTGAGDSFAGGFLGHLVQTAKLSRSEIRRAAVYGSVLASFVIEDFSVERFRTLKRGEIEKRFREFRRLVSF